MATSINAKSRLLTVLLAVGMAGVLYTGAKVHSIEQFNQAALRGGQPDPKAYPYEAKFAAAYWLAKQGRYQDATQLYGQLLEAKGRPDQTAAVQYNLGNIFMIRGLMVNHNGDTVKDEAEYLLNQARLAFQQSLRLDSSHMDVRHHLDWVLSMLPAEPNQEEKQDKMGIVMGNIPTGLP
jgi:mxaK protein